MKHAKRNSIIILIITIGILFYILKDDFNSIVKVLQQANLLWLFITILLYFIYFIFDQLSLHNIIKQYNKNFKFQFSLYLGIITKFFNGITPLASGGQPMEVYEMHKKGVSYSNGANIVIQNYIVFQIALVFWAILAIVLNQVMHLFAYIPILKQLTIIGFIINFVILILLFLISFSKNFNKGLVNVIIGFLSKIKLVKDKEKSIEKWNKRCDDYYDNAKLLLQNKKVFIKCTLFQTISLGIYYVLPLFIAWSLNLGDNLNVINTIAASSYIYVMGCYVPIPGASGGMEYAFLGFFGNFLIETPLKALLILWRFLTYYVPTIVGAIIFNVANNQEK
ncbi:MAG: flippase-like domain-containing protein [Bacilli bacterium]|nr:flippase-like domain-containing protein [Bacilli bacterium]